MLRRSSARTPSIVIAPLVTAASPMNEPISMWSGPTVQPAAASAAPLEGEEMRVHAPPADHVAARRRETHPAEAREHRAGQEDRGPDTRAQRGIKLPGLGARRIHLHGVRPKPTHVGAEMRQQGE